MAIELFSEKTERALLGLLIFKPELSKRVVGLISSTDFYFKENALIFTAFLNCFSKMGTVDEILLIEELSSMSNKSKNEWVDYVSLLILEKGLESNVEKYTLLIKEKQQTRALEETLKESVSIVSEGTESVSELIGKVETKIFNVTKNRELKDFLNVETLTSDYQMKVKKMEQEGFQDGLKTKIGPLDEKIGGLKGGEFIVLAGRPSMGKTAVALEIGKNISESHNVGIFSLEMPSEQLIKRMISSEAMIDQKQINRVSTMNQISQNRVESAINKIKGLNLWIDDSATLKVGELAWKARKLNDLHNVDLIIIDYLQLINSESNNADNRQQAISDISRQLKSLARELDIPVIALSQLSRNVEKREDKRPQMSDIRESGAIEQDADLIMFIFREDYYKQKEENTQTKPISDLEIIISKHRNGPTGIVKLGFDLSHGKIKAIHTTYNK